MGTFHSIGAKDSAPPRRARRPEAQFHHSRHRRSDPAVEAAPQAENIDEKRWPARALGGPIDALEEPRPRRPPHVAAGEAAAFANGTGAHALQGLSGAAEDAQRRRFRRSAAGKPAAVARAAEVLAQYQRRFRYILVDEYQDTNVVQYLWLRLIAQSIATCAASATTTSRSTAGAAPKSTTSCASSAISPARP